jgi:hypothetical protein
MTSLRTPPYPKAPDGFQGFDPSFYFLDLSTEGRKLSLIGARQLLYG